MASQVPFTGGSGRLIDRGLETAGVAKRDVFTTNVVHCHPPGNRPSFDHEVANCRPFLSAELQIVDPLLVIGLGHDARAALIEEFANAATLQWPFNPRESDGVRVTRSPHLLFAPHPSWVMRQPGPVRDEYVESLGSAIAWGFDRQLRGER
jgi:uracil-DNA glycosylase family 4